MARAKGVVVDPAVLERLCDERVWSAADLAENADLGRRTVQKMFSGEPVYKETVQLVAAALKVDPKVLLAPPEVPWEDPPAPEHLRRIDGVWKGEGEDIELPGRLEYAIPVVRYKFEMTVTQAGRTFTATGWLEGRESECKEPEDREKGRQPFAARGSLREGGNYVLFEWKNARLDIHDYGTALFELTDDAENQTIAIRGFFVGRERNHGTPWFLGELRGRRVPPPADIEGMVAASLS